jgi:hypothetical protein
MSLKSKIGYFLIFLSGAVFCVALLKIGAINQEQGYHEFVDKSMILGVPNFWNVISNLPFLIVGLIGIVYFKKFFKRHFQYLLFFIGILLVSFGSGYYHMFPSDQTLVLDRLPMTMVFMALLSILISDFFNEKIGKTLLLPLLISGVFSIIWWLFFDDLRLYVFVQFYPVIVMLIVILSFKTKYNSISGYWLLLVAYIFAKISEHYDYILFEYIGFSGHALKHIISALGVYLLLRYFQKRISV